MVLFAILNMNSINGIPEGITRKLKTHDIKNAKLFLLPVRHPAYFEVLICHDKKESEPFDEAIHGGRYSHL